MIWANHLMRASITAMQATAAAIQREQSLVDVEPVVAPLAEVFRLQQEEELSAAERQYLPGQAALAGVEAERAAVAFSGAPLTVTVRPARGIERS